MTRTLILLIAIGGLALAKDATPPPAPVIKTQRMDFPANGTLRIQNSTGELTVEAWDQPGMEITTILGPKINGSAKGLDLVKISTERKGDEIIVATGFPIHSGMKAFVKMGTPVNFSLEIRVKVPKTAKVIATHNVGDMHFDGIEGDIEATARQGNMTLQLPANATYAIDAQSRIGSVVSDFEGASKAKLWFIGQQFSQLQQAPHKLYLRNGYGDIVLLKHLSPVSLLAAMNP